MGRDTSAAIAGELNATLVSAYLYFKLCIQITYVNETCKRMGVELWLAFSVMVALLLPGGALQPPSPAWWPASCLVFEYLLPGVGLPPALYLTTSCLVLACLLRYIGLPPAWHLTTSCLVLACLLPAIAPPPA